MTGEIKHIIRRGVSLNKQDVRAYSAFEVTGEDGNKVILSPTLQQIFEMLHAFIYMQRATDIQTHRTPMFPIIKDEMIHLLNEIENLNMIDTFRFKFEKDGVLKI